MDIKIKEKDIERNILIYLNSLPCTFAWKNHSVGVFDPIKKTFRKPKSKFLINGVADIICLKAGIVFFLEVKSSIGKQTVCQKDFGENISKRGGRYYVVRSIDDVKNVIGEL